MNNCFLLISWVFPSSRRDRAASIDALDLKNESTVTQNVTRAKKKSTQTCLPIIMFEFFMLHIQKKYRNAQSKRQNLSGLNKHNLPLALWTHPEVNEFQTLCTWASSAASCMKAQQELLNFLFTGLKIAPTCSNKVSTLCTKRKKYQPETSYRTFQYKHHTCNDWFVHISVILLPNDHLKPQDHTRVSRFDWLKWNVSHVIAADQTARMLHLETRDLNPARCEITWESPWWLGLFFRGAGSLQSQKTFFMGKSGW